MKKVRVRIAVAVSDEEWCARGSSLKTDYNTGLDVERMLCTEGQNHHVVWVEALVPLPPDPPEEIVVRGRVK